MILPTNKNIDLVSTTNPTDKGGEYLQFHMDHDHDGMIPHAHYPVVNINPDNGRTSSNRASVEVSSSLINYADEAIKSGVLRPRSNKKDKGGC